MKIQKRNINRLLPLCLLLSLHNSQATAQMPSDGYVTPNSFLSAYFGFTYKLPDHFVSTSNDLEKKLHAHPQPSEIAALLFSASEPNINSNPRRSVAVIAHLIPQRSNVKSGRDYMKALIPELSRSGWMVLGPITNKDVFGHNFSRVDYSKARIYQSVVCTVTKGYIVSFLFTGKSQLDLDSLVESVNGLRFSQSH